MAFSLRARATLASAFVFFFAHLALFGYPVAAHGGTPAPSLEDTTTLQRFACLHKERELEPLAAKTPSRDNAGFVRVKLRFTAADAPPRIEWLQDRADPDMLRLARRYLEGYRLPCLQTTDEPVEALQEFSFHRWGHEPPVPLRGEPRRLKAVLPAQPFELGTFDTFRPGKALVELSFLPDREEPEVRFVFSGIHTDMERRIAAYVKQYRLDPEAQRPAAARQTFVFTDVYTRGTQYRLRKDSYTLIEFLRLTRNLREQRVDLDLDRMACPFAVRVNLRQPYEANGVFQLETRDDARVPLLDWLARLQMRYADEAQQKDLYGTDVRVEIPCGRLDLREKPDAAS